MQNKKNFFITVEKFFTIVSLMFYSGGPLTLILSGGKSDRETPTNNSLLQLCFLLIYLITFFLLMCRWKKVIYILSKVRFSWLLLMLCVASILWSAAPQMTFIRSFALAGTTLFGMYFATRYSLKEQLNLMTWMCAIAIILSLLFAIGLPQYGLMSGKHGGAVRGIYTHKNVFGQIMVLAGVSFLLSAISTKSYRWLWWSLLGISIGCLVLSRSSSSMLNFIILTSIFLLLCILRFPVIFIPSALSFISLLGGISYVLLQTNLDSILGLIGKDASLTGRTDLWPLVWERIWERPWLGYGFSAFWQGLNSESAYVWYRMGMGWFAPNSHNGLLDLWLDLGLLGVVIFLLGFVITLFKSLVYIRKSKTIEAFWPAICLFYLVLINLTETSLLIQNNLFWILYVAAEVLMIILSNRQHPNLAI